MDFSFTKDQKFFRDQVRRTLQHLVVPYAEAIDRDDRFPREVFGRSIGDFQLIQTKIAEMETRIQASEFLTYYAAWLKDNGTLTAKEAAVANTTPPKQRALWQTK